MKVYLVKYKKSDNYFKTGNMEEGFNIFKLI